ncbi:MAG: peptidoglycan-binding protein [Gloeotrichia echinulata DVL01]
MRLCPSSILIFTCFSGLGVYQIPASAATPHLTPEIFRIAQATPTPATKPSVLKLGSTGSDVETLQTQLKELGYYNGEVDGQYRANTKIAVSEFQKAQGLLADGIAGRTTQESLQAAMTAKTSVPPTTPSPAPSVQPNSTASGFIWWLLLGLGVLGTVGAFLYVIRRFGGVEQVQYTKIANIETEIKVQNDQVMLSSTDLDSTPNQQDNMPSVASPQPVTAKISPKLLPTEKTSRLTKVNIVDELIIDLHSLEPTQRRKAIWDLGQQGDSRAIQPLLDLMMDADSQQRSLILAALGEIGIRTLKPMNRALAISLQDESPQVRQNAIRDLTRIYDMMTQISHLLRHALEDPDPEVQSTARYALAQINRIRTVPEPENLSPDSHKQAP